MDRKKEVEFFKVLAQETLKLTEFRINVTRISWKKGRGVSLSAAIYPTLANASTITVRMIKASDARNVDGTLAGWEDGTPDGDRWCIEVFKDGAYKNHW